MGLSGQRRGGGWLTRGPAGRSRRRQVGPAAQEGRARGASPAVERACWAGSARGRGPLRRWAGADRVTGPRGVSGPLRGKEREEWAGAGLTWVGFWLGFGLSGFWVLFLISISLLSKSNSNIV